MFSFDIIYNVTSFVILFSRTQPLHFENCLIIKTKWEIYDLWRKKKISICKYEIMINPSFISATQTSCQGVLEELQLGCAYTKYFPSCCLQVYLIRGVCHVSHFFFFVFIKKFKTMKITTKIRQLQFIQLQNILLCTVCVTSHNLAKVSYPLLWLYYTISALTMCCEQAFSLSLYVHALWSA